MDVEHNAKISFYPDGRHKLLVASKPIFKEEGWEKPEFKEKIPKPQNRGEEVREDSVRRAQQMVFDISRLNHFDYFITWTLDKEKIDRYNPAEISKKLKKFLNNKSQRNDLKYLIIPEYHKDGAIHMHGLISGDFEMVDSGTVIVKERKKPVRKELAEEMGWAALKTVYNMPQWTLGSSTAIELDGNVQAISRYIAKYVSKEFRKIFGNFYYAGGHGLERKPPTQLYQIPYTELNEKEYTKFGTGYKYMELGDYSTLDDNARGILERIGVYVANEE